MWGSQAWKGQVHSGKICMWKDFVWLTQAGNNEGRQRWETGTNLGIGGYSKDIEWLGGHEWKDRALLSEGHSGNVKFWSWQKEEGQESSLEECAKGQDKGKLVKKIQRKIQQRGRKTKQGHVREIKEKVNFKEKEEFTQYNYA